jgi:hypothetical protein
MVACSQCAEVTVILHIQSSLAQMNAGALLSYYSCVGKAKLIFATYSSV